MNGLLNTKPIKPKVKVMSELIKATRATVQIGSITVDAFMLPDTSYRMSQTQAAEAIGKDEINARRFLHLRVSMLYEERAIRPTILRLNHSLTKGGKVAVLAIF